jgi:cytochrome P450
VRGRWPGAFAVAIARSPLGFVQRAAAAADRLGADLVRVRAAGRTIVVVTHPELAREVLVTQQRRFGRGYAHRGLRLFLGDGLLTSEDPLHRRQRRLVQPAFHRERVAAYARTMSAAAERWQARWAALAAAGPSGEATVDAAAEMNALTLGIAGETLFGASVDGAAAEVAGAVTAALGVAPLAFLPFGGLALASPLPAARRFREARARVDRVVLGMIADRRRARAAGGGDEPDDLLAMLLDATDPGSDPSGDEGRADPGSAAGAPMSDAQLRDEVVTLFLAGHETTASALAWTWHLLATHPAAQTRLHAELDAVLTAPDGAARAPAFDDLVRLPHTRQVLSEAMRLFPPAYAIGRLCLEPTTLGGYRVERGWGVLTSPWLAHHDARYWPEPERFLPERWAADDAARSRAAYFPFGGGSRICIGEQFAWTEMTLVLAALARRWVVRPVAGHEVRARGAVTLRPVNGVRVVLTPRPATVPGRPAGVQVAPG